MAPRRRVWHRQVGEALAESATPDPDAVAYHFQQAGIRVPGSGWCGLASGRNAPMPG